MTTERTSSRSRPLASACVCGAGIDDTAMGAIRKKDPEEGQRRATEQAPGSGEKEAERRARQKHTNVCRREDEGGEAQCTELAALAGCRGVSGAPGRVPSRGPHRRSRRAHLPGRSAVRRAAGGPSERERRERRLLHRALRRSERG
jgi:hypothetical protein